MEKVLLNESEGELETEDKVELREAKWSTVLETELVLATEVGCEDGLFKSDFL